MNKSKSESSALDHQVSKYRKAILKAIDEELKPGVVVNSNVDLAVTQPENNINAYLNRPQNHKSEFMARAINKHAARQAEIIADNLELQNVLSLYDCTQS